MVPCWARRLSDAGERKVIGCHANARRARTWSARSVLLQPMADGLKLVLQRNHHADGANRLMFILAPMITFILAASRLGGDPVRRGLVLADINVGVLYLFAISSLVSTASSWRAGPQTSNMPFLGALRSAAQMVSYEVSIGFVIISVSVVRWLSEPVEDRRGAAGMWFRHSAVPDVRDLLHLCLGRDQPRAFRPAGRRSGVGRGYNVEYSAMTFACSSSANTPT